MKKIIASICLMAALTVACTKEEIDKVLNDGGLSNEEVIAGLKQALSVGTDSSATMLSKVDGYYKDAAVKIFLPDEAQAIYTNISKVPGGSALIEQTVLTINRAAEDAADEAKPIFIDAITSMTIGDGLNILNGADTAATVYLKDKTYDPLRVAFQPKISASLSKPIILGISAEQSYKDLINAYNTASLGGLLFEQIKTNSLSEHVTRKGLDGLFLKVAEKEKAIRSNPLEQVTDLLKKVFGKK
ncbi:MAG: DUF4197 domain-containing protein [Bacteroidota bacterium]|jgi:hypothetical protein|nr:DUF4197 domain-containing protein [Sphingobacteriales bacterium]